MSDKPSYLGLLNAIAVGEWRGHALLSAWRDSTTNSKLAALLDTIAIREQEHAAAFTKRLCELGYSLKESPSDDFEKALAVARSQASDTEKFRRVLGYDAAADTGKTDPLARVFDDHSIDPQTGALLGRFIAEERDSERRLRSAWESLPADSGVAAGERTGGQEETLLADIAERIDRLASTLEDLKKLRR
jgi:rubrerythrin